jgi:hypothetical protein
MSNMVRTFHSDALLSWVFAALGQHADDCLGTSEIARAQEDNHPLALALENRHLAELGEIVDTGVGSRIRREDRCSTF